MKQLGWLDLSWRSTATSLFIPFSELKLIKNSYKSSAINVVVDSVNESPLTGRERRQLRNDNRERKPSNYNWKEEVEDRLLKKPKKRYASWTEELNLDNLASLGPQWWVVRVSRVTASDTAERLARSLALNFPSMEFKIYTPSVQIKRKLKNGSLSIKPKPLFPGCVFLRSVMNKELHDFIRECEGVGGFVGSKVGNIKRQINKPRPVDADDMDAIFKQVGKEQEKADQVFAEEQKTDRASDSEDQDLKGLSILKNVTQSKRTTKPKGLGRNAAKQPVGEKLMTLIPGSTVQIASGAFAGFSGTLKKFDKSGLITVGFMLFGKETVADIDTSDILLPQKI